MKKLQLVRENVMRNLALGLLAVPVVVSAQEAQHLNFVACPIFQDTDTVPCWVAEYEGEKYFLGIQTDASGWSPPWQGHQLLVEGTVSKNPRVCGGIVLESSGTPYDRRSAGSSAGVPLVNPPITSVMRELDSSCRTILPAQPAYNTIEPRRGPGPNVPPVARTPEQIAAAQKAAAERAQAERPVKPYKAKDFELLYDFDSELAVYTIDQAADALEYATAIGARSITVTGYRSSSLLSNGKALEEAPFMAKRRAQEIETTLKMLGLPKDTKLEVKWEDKTLAGNGKDDWTRRKAIVTVTP